MAGQANVKSGKTFRYQSIAENVVGRGAYGRVFAGHFKPNMNSSWGEQSDEEKQAAIKRVEINFSEENWMDIKNDREVVALKELRHPCIVRLFAVEDDDNFRNYIFELCQATLEDFITKEYDGLMPDETEGLYQMASGLKFIHEKNMIHRDIQPENVLVYLHEEGRSASLKIADLGFTKRLKEDGIHYDLASGLKGTEYYMAPELHVLKNSTRSVLDKECTIASDESVVNKDYTIATDVFAAGCTFFRYLNGGLHPFGKGQNIEVNIIEGKPINATKYKGKLWKTNLLAKMVKFNPKERPSFSTIVEILEIHLEAPSSWSSFPSVSGEESLSPVIIVEKNGNFDKTGMRNVGDVQFDRSNIIDIGSYGVVYAGTFKGENVAVKRVELMDSDGREKDLERPVKIQQLLNHQNIVQFKHHKKDNDFGYIVMELCAAPLQDFIYGKYKGPMPTDEQVLFQLANGLEYIHSMGILHRDISPANILISLTEPVQMKWSGFGYSKPVNNKRGTFTLTGVKGIKHWLSPEEMRMFEFEENAHHRRESVKSEIFSAGCVFIFFLLRGKHPFGGWFGIPVNILNGCPVNELPEEHFARPFVLQMIENDPEKRISLREVIDHLSPLQPPMPLQTPNRLSLLQYDSTNLLFSTGTLSIVYHVGTFEGSPLAVKRVPRKNCTTKSFEELKQLKHQNIIRILYDDEGKYGYHRHFGMELCVASLDQFFLPEDDPKKYKGLIPSDEQFCFQLISGLEYIHEQNLVHGSIKPTNVLISSCQDPQIKLSDFGLTTSCLNDGHTTKRLICGFLSSRYWLAPELLESDSSDGQFTKESDIFAAGSVFFYFLSKGCHLFGNATHEILKNTCEGNQFNLFKKMTVGHFAIGLIRWMTQKDHTKRRELFVKSGKSKKSVLYAHLELVQPIKKLETVGTIQFSREHLLDSGGYGSVFLGRCESSNAEVVVKRIQSFKQVVIDRELKALQNLSHPNIVKFFDSASDADFRNIAIEKCLTSLDKYCRQPLLYHGLIPMPTDQQVLLQMAKGLHYIHSQIVNDLPNSRSQPLIHRDVKPGNILISCNNPAVIKWADFGLARNVVNGSETFEWSKVKGTERWFAPELSKIVGNTKVRGSQRCDVFALGCVFFFFLKQGIHPFGDDNTVQVNIDNGIQVNLNQLSKKHFAFSIIEKMIQNDPHSRPKMSAVVDDLQLPATSDACLEKSWNENISRLQNLDLDLP